MCKQVNLSMAFLGLSPVLSSGACCPFLALRGVGLPRQPDGGPHGFSNTISSQGGDRQIKPE